MAVLSLARDMAGHQLSIPSELELPSTSGNVYTLLATQTFLHIQALLDRLPSLVCTYAQYLGDGFGGCEKKSLT